MDRANDAIQALREQGTAAHPGPDGSLIIRTLVSVSVTSGVFFASATSDLSPSRAAIVSGNAVS